ncbi:hypothetical protein ACFL2Q_04400 [Thermodesulfobacteriota bacterium]
MKRTIIALTLLTLACAPDSFTWAAGTLHTKLMPHTISYPLIPAAPFPSGSGDALQRVFGVLRLLKSFSAADQDKALLETYDRHQVYGAYGVLGRGEDIFTSRARRYRKRNLTE